MIKSVGTTFLVVYWKWDFLGTFILIGRETNTTSDLQKLEISIFNEVLVTLKFVLN